MSENLSISSPDFDLIEKEAGVATRNAVNTLWFSLNQEISLRRKTVRDAKQTLEVKASNAAPTTNQDNFDTDRSTIYYFTGSTNFNLTGIRNGVEGAIIVLHNIGTATITIKHNVTSDASNRLLTSTSADKSLTTNQSIMFMYLNTRWREYKGI
jgi:hypothetical protein